MRYSITHEGDVLLVEIKSPAINEPEAPNLHLDVKEHIEKGARKVLLDFKHCSFSTSGGIGVVVAIYISLGRVGGRLKLCCVNDRVRTSFVVAGVWSLFEVYDTREEALAAFSSVTV